MTNQIVMVEKLFDGKPLVWTYQGEPHVPLRALGAALGYSEGGEGLVNTWSNSWKGEFKEGHHFKILKGKSLKEFKELTSLTNFAVVSPNAPKLMLMTLVGVNRVLLLTGKPIGLKLRDWLDTEVLPQIQKTGQYVGATALTKQQPSAVVVEAKSRLQVLHSAARMFKLCGGMDAKDMMLFRDRTHAIVRTVFPGVETGSSGVLPETALRTVADLLEADGVRLTKRHAQQIGKLVAKAYREKHGGVNPALTIQQRVDGREVAVLAYLPPDHHLVFDVGVPFLKVLSAEIPIPPKPPKPVSTQEKLF